VREAAFWSLARAHATERGTQVALERALAAEEIPAARAGMHRTLEQPAASNACNSLSTAPNTVRKD
jgi:hypothetical protein